MSEMLSSPRLAHHAATAAAATASKMPASESTTDATGTISVCASRIGTAKQLLGAHDMMHP